jgi:hypothetical protein
MAYLRVLCCAIILIICTEIAEAQSDSLQFRSNRIGVTASTASGYGLTYIFNNGGRNHLAFNGIMAYTQQNPDDNRFYANLGFEYQYDLLTGDGGRVFTGVGGSRWIDAERFSESDRDVVRRNSTRFGLIAGVQTANSSFLSLTLSISYQMIYRSQLTFVGFGGGVTLTAPIGRKKRQSDNE